MLSIWMRKCYRSLTNIFVRSFWKSNHVFRLKFSPDDLRTRSTRIKLFRWTWIWAAFERFDFDTWEKSPIEQVHLRFFKHLLEVNSSTMNLLCRAELGRRPIKLITDLEAINFYKHCKFLPTDDLSYIVLDQDCIIFNKKVPWLLFSRALRDLQTIFGDNFISKENHQQKSLFLHIMIKFGNQNKCPLSPT